MVIYNVCGHTFLHIMLGMLNFDLECFNKNRGEEYFFLVDKQRFKPTGLLTDISSDKLSYMYFIDFIKSVEKEGALRKQI